MSGVADAASSAIPAAAASAQAPNLTGIAGILLLPFRWIFLRALPFALSFLYAVALHLLSAVASVLLVLLAPFLFPFKLLVVKPSLAVLALFYSNRHVIYFASVAVLLGATLGYLSSLLIRRASKAAASAAGSDTTKPVSRLPIEPAEYRMGGTLYQEKRADSSSERTASSAPYSINASSLSRRPSDRPGVSRQQSGSSSPERVLQPKESVERKPSTGHTRAGQDRFASAMRTLAERRNKRKDVAIL